MLKKLLLLSLNFVLVLIACKGDKINDNTNISKDKKTTTISQGKGLGYDFDSPQIIVLDRQLMEISGLAYHPSKDVLLAHNDEKGHVYEISKSEGKILEDYKFDKKGDYESVEFHEGQYIICSSSGNLHLYNPENKETEKIKTKMSSKNDIEGMCLDPTKTQLLLACKGQGISDSKKKDIKAVYAFDMQSKIIKDKPYLTVIVDQLKDKVKSVYASESKSKVKKLTNRVKDFAPSGIAIHPLSKEYYLISARGSTLVILDTNRQLKDLIFLNDKSNKQPEGICFDGQSNLYISTEGHGLSAKIFKFNYTKN